MRNRRGGAERARRGGRGWGRGDCIAAPLRWVRNGDGEWRHVISCDEVGARRAGCKELFPKTLRLAPYITIPHAYRASPRPRRIICQNVAPRPLHHTNTRPNPARLAPEWWMVG